MMPFPALLAAVPAIALTLAVGAGPETTSAEDSVLATLAARGDATAFLALIEQVGEEAVFPDGEFTLYAPTDAAVRALPEARSRLLTDPAHRDLLVAVLRHHVVPGRLDLAGFGRNPRRASLHGRDLALRQTGDGGYLVDSARLVELDIPCSDGLLNLIDEVLVPADLPELAETAVYGTGRHVYTVDPTHSAVLFRVMHMQVGAQWGLFRGFAGEIAYDHDDPENSEIILAVDATSIDTGNSARDSHLQAPDFFSASDHPGITYRSTKVTDRGDGVLDVEGVLTMLGVEVAVPCRVQTLGQGRFGKSVYKVGFEAEMTIRRSEFGMTYGIPGVAGDEVRLIVALEADRDLPLPAGR